MSSCVVCREAEPASSAAILHEWRTARVSGIPGYLEDEGRFLQDVYPTEDVCGGPGRFGFDPRAHLTEASPLLTQENADEASGGLARLLG